MIFWHIQDNFIQIESVIFEDLDLDDLVLNTPIKNKEKTESRRKNSTRSV